MNELQGPLEKLAATRGVRGGPARYELVVGDGRLALNPCVGAGLEIEFLGRISCRHCAAPTRRSYAQGYCYRCFKTLARCDLCVVSPDRCHYHEGTCREPAWGEAFCMSPHLVYLANSSGAKGGITRAGQEVGRWLEQGAVPT